MIHGLADRLGITERTAHGIVTDLTEAGYVIKHKDGRRNRYQIQAHMPLPEPASQEPAIGEVLALLAGASPASGGSARTGDRDAGGIRQALSDRSRRFSRSGAVLVYTTPLR